MGMNVNTFDGTAEHWIVNVELISPLYKQTMNFYLNANEDLTTVLLGLI